MFFPLHKDDAISLLRKKDSSLQGDTAFQDALQEHVLLQLPNRSDELDPLYLFKVEYNIYGHDPVEIDEITRLSDDYIRYYHINSRYRIRYHYLEKNEGKFYNFYLFVEDERLHYSCE